MICALQSIISILRSSLEAHFTDKEADINLGWDEKETSSRGPRPSGQRCRCFKLSQVSVFSLLNTDFQQSEFVRSHTGTGGPNGVVSQVQGPGLLTLGSKGTSSSVRLHPGGELGGGYEKCGLGLRVWKMWCGDLRPACPPIRDAGAGEERWFWAFFLNLHPRKNHPRVFRATCQRVGRPVSLKLRF